MKIFRGWNEFATFAVDLQGRKILVVSDVNTDPFAARITELFKRTGGLTETYRFPDKHLVPETDALSALTDAAKKHSYILGVGSGVINDICKYISSVVKIPYGILATAPSMDGYVSSISALYEHGKKVTVSATIPQAVLIDLEVLKSAPLNMIVAGAGDMIGKYTSLMDWKLAHVLTGEAYDTAIVGRMRKALEMCMRDAENLTARQESAVSSLIEGLILSGVEMQNAGNSRPASGSEHHISHYLEMAGERVGKDFAPHGVKVALGCLVSVYLYRKAVLVGFPELQPLQDEILRLPTVEALEALYMKIGLPTRFGDIGVDSALLKETVEKSYTVRERYTIMTFIQQKHMLEKISSEVADRFA